MSTGEVIITTEIRAKDGARIHDLTIDAGSNSLYDVLVLLSQQDWAQDLFKEVEGRVTLVPGYMIVLGSRMVQLWEVETTSVSSGQQLKFVQVVPGG